MPEKLLMEIVDKNNYLWEKRLTNTVLDAWTENFRGEYCDSAIEKKFATQLLKNFIYYGEKEINYLCRAAFSLLKRKRIIENPSQYASLNTESEITQFTSSCRISYIGRLSESGAWLTMNFRQENRLSYLQFVEPNAFLTNEYSPNELATINIIFIDDFMGTGQTTCDFWDKKVSVIKDRCPNTKFHIIALIALQKAIEKVKSHTGLDVVCPQILDNSYRVFDSMSWIFQDPGERDIAKSICSHYGSVIATSEHALGYKDSQALVGFHHNIPDNTLPVIWGERQNSGGRWYPLFKRKHKY